MKSGASGWAKSLGKFGIGIDGISYLLARQPEIHPG
jgi:hypothetical protein